MAFLVYCCFPSVFALSFSVWDSIGPSVCSDSSTGMAVPCAEEVPSQPESTTPQRHPLYKASTRSRHTWQYCTIPLNVNQRSTISLQMPTSPTDPPPLTCFIANQIVYAKCAKIVRTNQERSFVVRGWCCLDNAA